MVDQTADERLSAAFHALSDPSRRSIIELLRNADELRVTDIARTFTMSLNAVSKHLKVLEEAHLVVTERDGRVKRHFLNPVPIHEIHDRWISRYAEPHVAGLIELRDRVEGD